MTREEAIKMLKSKMDGHTDTSYEWAETVRMAIKALEQEPSEIIHGSTYGGVSWGGTCKPQLPSGDLVSRQAVLDLCDMQDRYEIPYEYDEDGKHIKGYDEGRIINVTKLNKLSSVNPQEPKTGHWIDNPYDKDFSQCSECGSNWEKSIIENCNMDYCPNCGAKMVEEQESEDCRNCKKWEDCPCGKEGHESGTSQGYSIGECKDFEPQESDHKCHTCKHYTSGEYDGSCGSYICKGHSDWESEDKE